jgi:hypothetical protein
MASTFNEIKASQRAILLTFSTPLMFVVVLCVRSMYQARLGLAFSSWICAQEINNIEFLRDFGIPPHI